MRYIFSEPYHRLSNDYVTPHIPWASPYAGGSVRALVIARRWTQRETVELSQRLSLDYETIMALEDPDHFYPTKAHVPGITGCGPKEFREEFERKLAGEYDVILMGNYKWKVLPPDIEQTIASKIQGKDVHELLLENMPGILDLAAAGAGKIAAKKRLEHQHERIPFLSRQLVFQNVGGNRPHL